MANTKREYLTSALSKIKLHNAGEKINRRERPVAIKEPTVHYPSLYLNIKQVPELAGYDVEDECTLVVKGKITSHSVNEHRGSEARETFDIEIRQIGIQGKKK